jgi:hypothetical protein
MEERTHEHKSMAELLTQQEYTPEELAELVDIHVDLIRHVAFDGTLPAKIVNHDIISIRREDALHWLANR